MKINANEIEHVEDAGELDGFPVKLVRTKGGFWMSIGRPRGQAAESVIGAGSHPAIVRYNVQKQFPTFCPQMAKSEGFQEEKVDKHSHFLSDDLRKSGHDIYSVESGLNVHFLLTKHNVKVADISTHVEENNLVVTDLQHPKEATKAIAGAITEKALMMGAKKVIIKG